jgi:3-oxoacyl-[acyl-carrier protein] reductase
VDSGIKNKKFLVTGSSRGIGFFVAQRLLEEGAVVCLTSRSQKDLAKANDSLRKKFGSEKVLPWVTDFCDPIQIEKLKDSLICEWNGIDGVVANVGDGRSVSVPISSTEHWQRIWSVNFDSALNTSRTFIPQLRESRGSIVFVSSICGVEALGAPVDYSVAKSAIISLAKNLSRKVAPDVRVNVVAPGNVYFKGGVWDEKMKSEQQKTEEMIKSKVPMKRFGKPEEIADAVVFLSSERASFITGSVLRVDGGQTTGL